MSDKYSRIMQVSRKSERKKGRMKKKKKKKKNTPIRIIFGYNRHYVV